MNEALAEFLLSLLSDPERLRRFNTEEGRAQMLEQDLTLASGDKAALMSEDSADVLRQLQVAPGEEDQLMWVVGPGIKPPVMIGWGIKGPVPPEPETRQMPGRAKSKPGTRSRKSSGARKSTPSRSRKNKRSRGRR